MGRMNIDDKLRCLAVDSLGIHPAAVIDAAGEPKARDSYGDGWNAAVMAISHRWVLLESWRSQLTDIQRDAFDTLVSIDESRLEVDFDGEAVHLSVRLNDVFIPAAVTEDIKVENLVRLFVLESLFKDAGIIAFFADRYTCPPRKDRVHEERYQEALAYIKSLGP